MITISPELEAQINQCAQHAGYQPTELIQHLITEYLEDIKDAIIPKNAYQEFIESGQKAISYEQVILKNDL